jgi:opacity protein-like surface antigen
MNGRESLRTLLLTAALAAASAASVSASSDELYYPASNCHPFDGASWQGGGSSGFAFLPSMGGWYNFDANDRQALVCPVPYFRNTNNLEAITVRVVVDDRHGSAFTQAFLCGKDSTGPKICDSDDNFPTVFGTSTIELTIQPNSSTRFVWIEVLVPDNDDDNNAFTLNGTSGVIGYRVIRD